MKTAVDFQLVVRVISVKHGNVEHWADLLALALAAAQQIDNIKQRMGTDFTVIV